ncbi:RusA family crossover junction endodeoxyribonuclease [Prauserella cavernicola]|uniref:RusA family crossover junction endodeoxyribonuclease n=1 Tax=Prauserella cavernicola TaxID=2800127 RepID=A0A934QR04_9PSEU|nr:RusA family crossover junction endodeoxyribonuclease [Prauserella cavernicola]MBK1785121.1 RusA family crossover junction endodeoxyribonuclease [Prauserella cavernicola]
MTLTPTDLEHVAAVSPAVFVPGIPRPQGSKRAFHHKQSGKIVQMEVSQHVKTWRGDIRDALVGADRPRLDGSVDVDLVFVMPRPKSHYRTGRNAHLLRDNAPVAPTGKPDIDKLVRAVLDAIGSAGVWGDDSQVVELHAVKRYAGGSGAQVEASGVHITIRAVA